MWGRVVAIMTAVWLALSPWIFDVADEPQLVWADNLLALSIATLAGLSYWRPLRHAHLANLLVAIGLILWGRFGDPPPIPIHQNHIVVGIFLLMIAIIPNDASYPPEEWRADVSEVGR